MVAKHHPGCKPSGEFPSQTTHAEWSDLLQAVRRLPRRDPFRQIGERFLAEHTLVPEDVSMLCSALWNPSAWRWRQQEMAALCLSLAPLTPTQRREAAASLLHVLRARRWEGAGWKHLSRVSHVALPAALTAGLLSGDLDWFWQTLSVLQTSGMLALWPVSLRVEHNRVNRLRWVAAHALERLGEPTAIPDLAETARERSGAGFAAVFALQTLLPTLSTAHLDDLNTLSPGMVPNLCRLLWHDNDALVRTVLDALAVVGDGTAAAPVARLAERGHSELVREAAQRVLPILQSRQRREYASRTLLRASHFTDDRSDKLLRPVEVPSDPAPEQLLRASRLRP